MKTTYRKWLLLGSLVFCLNLGSAWLVQQYFPANMHTVRYFSFIPLWLAWTSSLVIVTAVYLLLQKKANYGLLLVLVGFVSNLMVYRLFGSFVDFIPTGLSFINLPDICIVLGGILWYLKPATIFE